MRMMLAILSLGLVIIDKPLAVAQDSPDSRMPADRSGSQITADHKPATLDLEPRLDTQKLDGRDDAFASKTIGVRQKWQLDRGHFDTDERISGVARPDEASEDYSGIRLRRPRRP